jgi:hypothetical protein
MHRFFVMIAVCMVLTACGNSTLTPDNSVTVTAASRHNSEQTYRNLLRVIKDCYPDGFVTRSNFFPEAKEGEIDLFTQHELGNTSFATWSVKPDAGGAIVNLTRRKRFTGHQDVLPEWIEGDARNCPHGTRFEPRPPGSELNQNIMPAR